MAEEPERRQRSHEAGMPRREFVKRGGVLLASGSVLTACGVKKSSSSGGGGSSNTIEIGYVSPITGEAASFGEPDTYVLGVVRKHLAGESGGVGEFRITFYNEPTAMDEVKVEVELARPDEARAIQARLRQRLGLRIRIVPIKPGILPVHTGKAQRVVDLRKPPGVTLDGQRRPWPA